MPSVNAVGLTHYLRGTLAKHREDHVAAERQLRLSLLHLTQSPVPFEQLSGVIARRDPKASLTLLELAIAQQGERPSLLAEAGARAWQLKRVDQALRFFQRLDDKSFWAAKSLAPHVASLLWMQREKEAIQLAQRNPTQDAERLLALASTFEEAGRLSLAQTYYQHLLRTERPMEQGAEALSRLWELQGDFEKAANTLLRDAKGPHTLGMRIRAGVLFLLAGKEQRGTTLLREARQAAGRDAQALWELAMGWARVGRGQQAHTVLQDANHPELRTLAAELAFGMEEFARCSKQLKAATFVGALLLRAQCLMRQGQSARALALWKKAFEQSDWEPQWSLELANAVISSTEAWPGARMVLREALAKTNTPGPLQDAAMAIVADHFGQSQQALALIRKAYAHRTRGEEIFLTWVDMETRLGHREEALAEIRKRVAATPYDVYRLNTLGFALASQKRDLREAEWALRRAYRLAPQESFVADSLAWVLYQRGELPQALILSEAAASYRPWDTIIQYHRGAILLAARRPQQAQMALHKALRWGPPAWLRPRIQETLNLAQKGDVG